MHPLLHEFVRCQLAAALLILVIFSLACDFEEQARLIDWRLTYGRRLGR